jgi:hypothetical protein
MIITIRSTNSKETSRTMGTEESAISTDGNPGELKREAPGSSQKRKRSTEAFMQAMREQAAKQAFSGNCEIINREGKLEPSDLLKQ